MADLGQFAPLPWSHGSPEGQTDPASATAMIIRPSLLALVSSLGRVAAFVAVLVAGPLVVGLLTGDFATFAAAVLAAETGLGALIPLAIGLAVPAVRLANTRYELDARGVRVHSSVLSRSDQRVLWEKVTLLVQQRSLLDRILGIQSLQVVAYGARGTSLRLVGLRDADRIRTLVADKMRQSASVDALFRND